MMNQKLTLALPAALLGLGVLLVNGIREQHVMHPRAPMSTITPALNGVVGRDLVVPEEERKVAGMTDYIMRAFGPDSAPAFTVYVGYYDRQVQGKAIHSPKNCLPGAGWEILSAERVRLPGGALDESVNSVVLVNKGTRALVYYWYQGRGRAESSEYKVKWNLLRDAAVYGRTEEALVRIVVPIASAAKGASSSQTDASLAAARVLADSVAPTLAAEVRRAMPASPSS